MTYTEVNRARAVDEVYRAFASLIEGHTDLRKGQSWACLEAALSIALVGVDELPPSLVSGLVAWRKERTSPSSREMTRRVWHAVVEASGQLTTAKQLSKPRNLKSISGASAFEVAAKQLNLSVGKLSRIFYAERKRRLATGGWVPEVNRRGKAAPSTRKVLK